jgi:hypothetical protein
MSVLCAKYIEEIAEGRIPSADSEEAKEFRAWSWAQKQLESIKAAARELTQPEVDEYLEFGA